MYLKYWTALRNRLEAIPKPFKLVKPLAQSWYALSIGKNGVWLTAAASRQKARIKVALEFTGPLAQLRFSTLRKSQSEIDQEMGEPLQWHSAAKQHQVRISRDNCDLEDESQWPDQHEWLISMLIRFHQAFASRVKLLPSSRTDAELDPSVVDSTPLVS